MGWDVRSDVSGIEKTMGVVNRELERKLDRIAAECESLSSERKTIGGRIENAIGELKELLASGGFEFIQRRYFSYQRKVILIFSGSSIGRYHLVSE
jgi:hypothetical protein